MALLDKVPQRIGILRGIAGGEPLVGHVKQGKVAASLNGIAYGPPLLGSRIDARRVVSAGMQEEDGVFGSSLDILQQAVDVEADSLFVVIPVTLNVEFAVAEDSAVVCPGWSGEVHSLVVWVESLQESTSNPQGAGTGDGLSDGDVVEHRAVGTVGEGSRSLGERWNAGNPGILLIE